MPEPLDLLVFMSNHWGQKDKEKLNESVAMDSYKKDTIKAARIPVTVV